MKKQGLAVLLVLVLTMGLFAGCGSNLPAVYVQAVADIMGYGTVGEFNTCAGVVIAQKEVKVEKDEGRTVAEIMVEAGQTVSEGDVLFVYDTEEMKLTIDKAELEIEQLKNNVKDYTSQIQELEKEKKKVSESDQLAYTVQIQALETDKKEAEYNITVKQRELEALKNADASGEVKSTIDGTVQSINENDSYDQYTGQKLPFMTLIQSGAYRVKGKVNELNRQEFFVGQNVILRSRVDSSQTWTGVIAEIDTNPEQNNNSFGYYYDGGYSDELTSSSSYPFYVDLDSVDGLMLGQHLYVEPNVGQTEEQSGLRLDASFVVSDETGYFVWAADKNDKLEKRSITVAQFDEILYQYEISGGLTENDRIAFPSEDLQEGAPVTDTLPEGNPVDENEIYGDGEVYGDGGIYGDGEVYGDDGIYEEGGVFGDDTVTAATGGSD